MKKFTRRNAKFFLKPILFSVVLILGFWTLSMIRDSYRPTIQEKIKISIPGRNYNNVSSDFVNDIIQAKFFEALTDTMQSISHFVCKFNCSVEKLFASNTPALMTIDMNEMKVDDNFLKAHLSDDATFAWFEFLEESRVNPMTTIEQMGNKLLEMLKQFRNLYDTVIIERNTQSKDKFIIKLISSTVQEEYIDGNDAQAKDSAEILYKGSLNDKSSDINDARDLEQK